jgi:hypothetical protein
VERLAVLKAIIMEEEVAMLDMAVAVLVPMDIPPVEVGMEDIVVVVPVPMDMVDIAVDMVDIAVGVVVMEFMSIVGGGFDLMEKYVNV